MANGPFDMASTLAFERSPKPHADPVRGPSGARRSGAACVGRALARLAAVSLCAAALIGCAANPPRPVSSLGEAAHPSTVVIAFATDRPQPVTSEDAGPLANRIVAFALVHLGRLVAGGECAELADSALAASGARSFRDFAAATQGDDYVWGTRVGAGEARPGDIVQFRGFQATVTTRTRAGENGMEYDLDHHTAIVEANLGGALLLLEQNADPGLVVQRTLLPIKSGLYAGNPDGTRKADAVTSVRVSGTMTVYRAQAAGAL